MKKVMLSIRPEWVEKILNGQKTIEIRKTMPKITDDTECEVYIYCTKGKEYFLKPNEFIRNGKLWREKRIIRTYNKENCLHFNGKVVAKFKLRKFYDFGLLILLSKDDEVFKKSMLTKSEMLEYSNGRDLYGWVIEDLEIFDEPRDLKDFGMNRPPQSWCYIKGVD